MLLWTFMYSFLYEHMFSFLLGKHLGVELLVLWWLRWTASGIAGWFSKAAAPLYMPTSSVRGFPFLPILIDNSLFLFFEQLFYCLSFQLTGLFLNGYNFGCEMWAELEHLDKFCHVFLREQCMLIRAYLESRAWYLLTVSLQHLVTASQLFNWSLKAKVVAVVSSRSGCVPGAQNGDHRPTLQLAHVPDCGKMLILSRPQFPPW